MQRAVILHNYSCHCHIPLVWEFNPWLAFGGLGVGRQPRKGAWSRHLASIVTSGPRQVEQLRHRAQTTPTEGMHFRGLGFEV